jgi:hypothetical protein
VVRGTTAKEVLVAGGGVIKHGAMLAGDYAARAFGAGFGWTLGSRAGNAIFRGK